MYRPTLREARDLAASGEYRRIPVSRELLSDFITPIQALRVLRARSRHCFLLESAADSAGWGRYTFLGFDPTLEITCKDSQELLGHSSLEMTMDLYTHVTEEMKQKEAAKITLIGMAPIGVKLA